MAEGSIPVDLLNPGQVFACLGFLEAANELIGNVEGAFGWRDRTPARFHLRAGGKANPFEVPLAFLSTAKTRSLAPANSDHDTKKWNVPTERLPADAPFPYPEPASPATLPVLLEGPAPGSGRSYRLVIDHWADSIDGTGRDAVKFWAGSGGYPGAALLIDALDAVRDRCVAAAADPFALSAPQSSSFRFDWRRDNIPIDLGFVLNEQPRIEVTGYPLVEVLAAIGLSYARPDRPSRSDKLIYRYGVLGGWSRSAADSNAPATWFDPSLLRAALGAVRLPFPQRFFRMHLGWPGKEGQARAITTVTEEYPE